MSKKAFNKVAAGLEEALSVERGKIEPHEVTVENDLKQQIDALRHQFGIALEAKNWSEIKALKEEVQLIDPDTNWSEDINCSVKDSIFDMFKRDQINLEQAQEIAKQADIDLSKRPIEKYDPKKEDFWSLPMTAAWIMWRNIDKVRDHWGEFLWDCWTIEQKEFNLPDCSIKILFGIKQQEAKNIFQTFEAARGFKVAPDNARKELLNKFKLGELKAWGNKYEPERSGYSTIMIDTGRVEITSTEWDYSYFNDHNGDYDSIKSEFGKICRNVRYKKVEILRDEVLKLWPEIGDGGQVEVVNKPAKQRKTSLTEISRRGGLASAKVRREKSESEDGWKRHAEILAIEICDKKIFISQEALATEIEAGWKHTTPESPSSNTLKNFIRENENNTDLSKRTIIRDKRG